MLFSKFFRKENESEVVQVFKKNVKEIIKFRDNKYSLFLKALKISPIDKEKIQFNFATYPYFVFDFVIEGLSENIMLFLSFDKNEIRSHACIFLGDFRTVEIFSFTVNEKGKYLKKELTYKFDDFFLNKINKFFEILFTTFDKVEQEEAILSKRQAFVVEKFVEEYLK